MKICIPTKGRAGKVSTIKHFDKKDIILFVEPQEYDSYRDSYPEIKIEMLSDNSRGIVFARNYILNRMNERFIMMDDDITAFLTRNEEIKSKYEHKFDANEFLSEIEKLLDEYQIITIPKRNFAKFEKKLIKTHGLIRQIYCIDPKNFEFRFDENTQNTDKILEDLDLTIQLLNANAKYCLFYKYVIHCSFKTKGGNEIDYKDTNKKSSLDYLLSKWGDDSLKILKTKTGQIRGFGPNYKKHGRNN